jgi:P-type E1-E2 ATPase
MKRTALISCGVRSASQIKLVEEAQANASETEVRSMYCSIQQINVNTYSQINSYCLTLLPLSHPFQKLVDAFARKYTPIVLVIAFLFCTLPWFFGVETGRKWMLKGLIFIVIACPCALTISTPVTYSAGLAAAAQRGIIIKGGGKLEALGNVKTILFDKTGTVTTGRFTLSHLDVVGETKSRKEL